MGYVAYAHFDSRYEDSEPAVYYASVIFADIQGRDIVAAEIKRRTEATDSVYLRGLQSYADTLDLIYKTQSQLIADGVTNILLVFEGTTLRKWLKGEVPLKYKNALSDINMLYGFGGTKEIRLDVGIAGKNIKSRVRKYCNANYLRRYGADTEYISLDELVNSITE